MRIFDCFSVFNELDLLEIRLAELYDHVDYFVIIEARQTHDGKPKPLHFQKNKARYKRFEKKIIHVVVDLPKLNVLDRMVIGLSKAGPLYKLSSKFAALGMGRMKLDHAQRRHMSKGLGQARDDDIIMISDLDEIPNVRLLKRAAALAKQGKVVGFEQKHFIYYLNGLVADNKWVGTKLCTFKYLRTHLRGDTHSVRINLRELVKQRLFGTKPNLVVLKNGGWHFTYLGGWERVILKKKVFAHSEISKGKDVDAEAVKKDIERGVFRYKDDFEFKIRYVPVDSTFPKAVVQNRRRYAKLIRTPSRS